MSIIVVRGLHFPESSFLGLRSSLNCEDTPYSGANESKCQGGHKWQLKCLPASLAQLKKELYNSPLYLEEKLILHMLWALSNTGQVHMSLHLK